MFGFVLLLVVGSAIFVGFDAHQIGARKGLVKGVADMSALGWVLGCLLLWIVAFPLYLAKRPQIKAAAGGGPESRSPQMSPSLPPQWMADPSNRHQHRWWNGSAWTNQVADGGLQALDVPPR
jgi:hypothetical protein